VNNKETSDKRLMTRRGLFAAGGIFTLAGLGAGTGALWKASNGFNDDIVVSGSLDISRGLTTSYIGNAPNPNQQNSVSDANFYKMDSNADPSVGAFQGSGSPAWLTDFTVSAEGENVDSFIVPKTSVNSEVLLENFNPEEYGVSGSTFVNNFIVISYLFPRINHEDTLVAGAVNTDYGYINTINDALISQAIVYSYSQYNNIAQSGAIPDFEQETPENIVIIAQNALSYEDTQGENLEEIDPTGERRLFSGNEIGVYQGQRYSGSINMERGINEFTILSQLYNTNPDNIYFHDAITDLNNVFEFGFDIQQVRRGRK